MQANTPKRAAVVSVANLDKTESMLTFLKSLKFVQELSKGVQSMKQFVYPSILQKQGIPAIKNAKTANICLQYQELSGVKLTYMLPMLNQQLRDSISVLGTGSKPFFSVVLCHSFQRC